MSFIIAIAGKGGTGKTTIASLLISIISQERKGSVLGIDADPNSNLAESLGLKAKEDIGGIVDSIAKNPSSIPVGMSKDVFIDFRVQTSILEAEGFDILTMGRPEGPGCYCYVNNLLRGLIKKLTDKYNYIIIDNEAGFEHLSRRTMRRAERLLLVSDSSEAGLRAVKRIRVLVKELELDVKKIFLILNRSQNKKIKEELKDLDIEVAGVIPEDSGLLELSRKGMAVTCLDESSAALIELKEIANKILE